MSNEIQLTQKYNKRIFHPFLLDIYEINTNTHAIMPELISTRTNTTINDYKYISNKLFTSVDNSINSVFGTNKHFLMYNFNINSIDDIFNLINNLIIAKNNIQTIDFMLNLIISTYTNEIDDVYIDKFIDFYKKYFKYFFNIEIEYTKVFKIFKKNLEFLDDKNKEIIHSNIINNILSK
jgi:hypothetical protein